MKSEIIRKARYFLLVLGLIGFNLTDDAFSQTATCSYFASPNGSGNGLSQSSPFKVANFWSVAAPGRTLCLLDGSYTGADSMITPPSGLNGSSGNPITIMALNDGAVKINAQGTRQPLVLNNNSWWLIQGIDVYNSSNHVVEIWANANNNIFRRIIAWDAPLGGNSIVFLIGQNTGNLFEDVAGFGNGRKIVEWYNSSDSSTIKIRRMWAQWSNNQIVGPKMTYSFMYNSRNALYENLIGTWNRQSGAFADQHYGIFGSDHHDSANKCYNSKILGSIGYVRASDDAATMLTPALGSWDVDCFEYKDLAIYIEPGTHTGLRPILAQSFDFGNSAFAKLTNVTSISSASPSIAGNWTQTNNSFVASVGSAPNIWNGAGTQGARVCKQYVNGNLTSNPLWPWPMDARIRAALITSGRNPDVIFGGTGNSVTQQMERMFGAIPAECRTAGTSLVAPGNLQVSAP